MHLSGLYRSTKPYQFYEMHGGGKVLHHEYYYVFFEKGNNFVGYYSAGDSWVMPYVNKEYLTYFGTYQLINNTLSIEIMDPFNNTNFFLNGRIKNGTLLLKWERYDKTKYSFDIIFSKMSLEEIKNKSITQDKQDKPNKSHSEKMVNPDKKYHSDAAREKKSKLNVNIQSAIDSVDNQEINDLIKKAPNLTNEDIDKKITRIIVKQRLLNGIKSAFNLVKHVSRLFR